MKLLKIKSIIFLLIASLAYRNTRLSAFNKKHFVFQKLVCQVIPLAYLASVLYTCQVICDLLYVTKQMMGTIPKVDMFLSGQCGW